ncbi:MAG: DUF4345 domain-containing protein [Chloroflexota bacterium]
MKRSLQIALLITALIPLALGVMNLFFGAAAFVPADQITPSLDNQLRFYAVWFTVVFFLIVWCVRNLEIAGPVMRIVFIVMALGGVARLFSIAQFGVPDPTMIGAIVIEIGVLAFIPWHNAYLRRLPAVPA